MMLLSPSTTNQRVWRQNEGAGGGGKVDKERVKSTVGQKQEKKEKYDILLVRKNDL